MSMICVGLLLLCVMFGYSNNYDENDYDPSPAAKAVSVAGTLGVVIGYATSFGPLTWLLTSEMFPSETRGRALGMSTVITYACAAMVSYTFLSLQETFQNPAMPFGVYLVLTLGAAVLVYFGIPETNTKSPDDIQRCMTDMVLWKYFSGGGTASSRQPRQSSLELQDLSKGVVC
uniref:Hexose transporter 1 n=1 Tax=Proboscia inermis TaxID=420281 RepID=A0A7S0BZJ5_9STRA|mmetsp:Transcript_17928/g.18141  ORF Transcript_17928/g.18141 Transcript_17928/m.18141 type:complete len:174 (+) Transcript_17928:375-896(+)